MMPRQASFYQGQVMLCDYVLAIAGRKQHWSRDYVGLPWQFAGRSRSGVDCWGLLWLIYRDVLRIDIASYAQETIDAPEREQIAALLESDRNKSPWRTVETGQPFDMAVFRRAGIESHVGLVVEPGRMLHILHGGESCIERFDTGRWRPKLIGLHRHKDLTDGCFTTCW